MSYVQCIVTTKMVLMSSDGRVSDGDKVLDENYKKIRRLNNNVLIGFAGSKEYCEKVVDSIKEKDADIDTLFEMVVKLCKKYFSHEIGVKGQFIIAGKSKSGELGFRTIHTKNNFETDSKKPQTESEICFCVASPDEVNSNILERELRQICNGKVSEDDLALAMLVSEMQAANTNKTINTVFYLESIHI